MDRLWLLLAVFITRLPASLIGIRSKDAESTARSRMPEDRLLRMLTAAGAQQRIRVVVIDANYDAAHNGVIQGFERKNGRWVTCTCPLPDLVYDRSFPSSAEERIRIRQALRSLIQAGVQPLSSELPDKLRVQEALQSHPELAPLLPPSWTYRGKEQLLSLLKRHPEGLFLKPAAGSQGRGALRVQQVNGETIVEGRTRANQSFSFRYTDAQEAAARLERFVGSSRFIVQPLLPLVDSDNQPHDVRLLMQKDDRGHWRSTCAVSRVGQIGGVTSNLHGGGSAEDAEQRLSRLFGSNKAQALLQQIGTAGQQAAPLIEQHYGRFAEFGFDFGLSQNGRLWLLEANSKPGRQSLKLTDNTQAERLSASRLLSYARKLAEGKRLKSRASNGHDHYALFPSDYVQEVHP
ncbi:YheC/D-like protein [Paenibacillus cellulosilyticus]|uniref:YheC/D-like protein n=1 Tax=Paenibacillus cellulosilyticus TaxID=375489 RepID=A0A2V2YE54_9BACL|nr:YheC/YheD family protein [Paenibacillus cellulosilyticus]PWV90565.1 YheC/D-like protein [Paenibacillus cellulosilyticus]QKS46770.1 YheC/YheD family protein [Paenibacillus cellulosilyticus]